MWVDLGIKSVLWSSNRLTLFAFPLFTFHTGEAISTSSLTSHCMRNTQVSCAEASKSVKGMTVLALAISLGKTRTVLRVEERSEVDPPGLL